MKDCFEVAGRMLGHGCPIYLICEIGINHEGDFALARRMVQIAVGLGVDSIKFQWERPGPKVAAWDEEYRELARLLFSREQMAELFSTVTKKGLACSAVVADKDDLEYVRSLGADYFKIESDDLTCLDLIREVGKSGAALMLSTGVATLEQVDEAVRTFLETGNERLLLLHTVSAYPTPDEHAELGVMDVYRSAFGCIVGYCDHTEGSLAVLAAAARGADVIEKHFTLDRSARGSDWEVSLEPLEFARLVCDVRRIESMSGDGLKRIFTPELGKESKIRRSLVAARNIEKGETFTRQNLALKKPGLGMGPEFLPLILGKPSKMRVVKDTLITANMA